MNIITIKQLMMKHVCQNELMNHSGELAMAISGR